MKNQKYHTVGTIPKSNIKIVERGKIDTANTLTQDHLLSWLSIGTSIKIMNVTHSQNKNVDIKISVRNNGQNHRLENQII